MSEPAGSAAGSVAGPDAGAAGDSAVGPTVGIVANPLAGKDVRRLTSGATPVSDATKIGAIRRAVVGAWEAGAERVLISGDRARLGERALAGLEAGGDAEVLAPTGWHTGRDSQLAAARFRDAGVGAVIALGGDGTQRDVAQGWRDVPLVPLAVGTNNVFPVQMEATLAGFAAGAVASSLVDVTEVTAAAKVIEVTLDGGNDLSADDRSEATAPDTADGGDGAVGDRAAPILGHMDATTNGIPAVALVDVCLVRGAFVGSRAVWESASVREIVAAVAEPASVGLSAIASAVVPVGRHEPGGVHVRLGRPASGHEQCCNVRAAVMPGSYADIAIESSRRLGFGDAVWLPGPGVLCLDGEREIVLGRGERAHVAVSPDGPQVIDVGAAVAAAQRQRYAFGPAAAGRREAGHSGEAAARAARERSEQAQHARDTAASDGADRSTS